MTRKIKTIAASALLALALTAPAMAADRDGVQVGGEDQGLPGGRAGKLGEDVPHRIRADPGEAGLSEQFGHPHAPLTFPEGRGGNPGQLHLGLERRFVVVDHDPDRFEAAKAAKFFCVYGDATQDETLQRAGIEKALCLVSCLPSDADNVFITLTARNLKP